MKNQLKTTLRLIAAAALCSVISACGQQPVSPLAEGFPSYGAQASSPSHFEAPSIMDY